MTEKQEKILQAALQLFAREGFHATSTSKVAKKAGVSEGLIFRHFGNKEGLLQAILEEGENRLKSLFVDIVMEPNPKEVIRKTIEMTDKIDVSDYDFWKLQFKLKWELEISGDKKMEPLNMALTNAFRKLNYESPELEAQLLILFIDGLGSAVLKGSKLNSDQMIQLLLKKYNI
ncbi:TetR/AcrR family transcriptional regulator [Maribellus maritimus]|uniref:TetR/AcrR family transcriptional regulator n=1 Tax=Maribellus maritimus TaxID=2870838 RepID=UPI001EEB73E8|nr:helix-turn-helix domain-containing protein [Maribellus maritimus]MCG6187266.1 TetR/AcrR family transcriptional regulator [Maribellus maritimus]